MLHSSCHDYQGADLGQILTPCATVMRRLEERARVQPADPYLTAVTRDGSAVTITYGELGELTARLAWWFATELGLRPGDQVAVLPRNDRASVLTIFGVMRAGCSALVLNPDDPRKRMAELLGAFDLRAIVAPSSADHELPREVIRVPDPASLPPAPASADWPARAGGDPAFLFGTSGSTATSRIVAQAHYNVAVNAEALRRHHALAAGVRVLGCLPIHHVNGLHFTLMATLWAGAHAVLAEVFKPALYAQLLATYRPHIASVVPSILETLLLSLKERSLPGDLRYFVSAAAPLSARTCGRVLERLGARVLQGYGLTETTNFSTTMPTGLPEDRYRKLMIDTPIPSIGVALYGNEVAVLREDGTCAEPGEVGEICMRGHNVMLGYTDPRATEAAVARGWFHSQDLGFARDDGGARYFVITGRAKNIAKVMGKNISLEEMERALLAVPDLSDAACFTEPDALLGESIVCVVAAPRPVASARLDAHLRDYFEASALPGRYVQAEAIPRTATGKLLRRQLASLHAGHSAGREE